MGPVVGSSGSVSEHDPGRVVMRRADGNPINVLVVDDEPVLAELVSMALRYEGWEIATAGDGATAIALARDNPPDVVVLDVMLPDMSGLDVLHRLRAQIPGLPLLLLTAKDSVDDRIRGLAAGGDDYVTKPFSLEEVLIRLHRLVQRSGVAAQDSDEAGGGGPGAQRPHPRGHARRRSGGSPHRHPVQPPAYSWRIPGPCCPRPRSWTASGSTTSAARPTSSSCTSPTCARVDAGREPMIHTVRGAGYVLKPAR